MEWFPNQLRSFAIKDKFELVEDIGVILSYCSDKAKYTGMALSPSQCPETPSD
ncbi:MAG: hypothetical protein ACJAWV_002483 [Flammeovirgaceae bacterium]|jgi:hypothetical protein